VLAGLKLLVVDDEADAREIVGRLLRDCGADVRSVDSAAAALRTMAEWRPDLLLSDIGMPEQNGYQLMQQIRAMPSQSGGGIPAIALTAFARPEDRNRAHQRGVSRCTSASRWSRANCSPPCSAWCRALERSQRVGRKLVVRSSATNNSVRPGAGSKKRRSPR
jgi:CheY-like chemotaxis protein